MRAIAYAAFILLVSSLIPPVSAHTAGADYWHDLSRLLAGMPVRSDSAFFPATISGTYRKHALKMDEYWERVESENIARIYPWKKIHIDQDFKYNTAFYPLCGGDFINLYTFFPSARRYIMVSMEPPGAIPDPLKLSEGRLKRGLDELRGSIWSIARINYFVTKAMRIRMNNPHIGGTLPVYLLFAARLNLRVTGIESVGIADNGMITALDNRGFINGVRPSTRGNRILFRAPGDTTDREILYLGMRLSPKSVDPRTPEGKFFSSLDRLNILIKSAIYLFHRAEYHTLGRFFLDRCSMLIQDDSGIPYRFLDNDQFTISLYGAYDRPVSLVEIPNPPRQNDLARQFKIQKGDLPFRFGYGVLRKDRASNLLLAVRKRGA